MNLTLVKLQKHKACGDIKVTALADPHALSLSPIKQIQFSTFSRMPKSSAKRKSPSSEGSSKKTKAVKPAKNNTSFLSQLQTLRDFTQGCTQYSETDLSNCLRSCGHNVQLAAEKLITGQYTSNSSPSGIKSGFFLARSGMDHSQQRGASAAKSNSKENNNVESSYKSAVKASTSAADKRLAHTTKPLSEKKKPMPTKSTVKKSTPKALSSVHDITGGASGLLLCQRWICALSTTRNGSIQYKETISIAHSSLPLSSSASSKATKGANIVRFKGNRIEGTLDTKLSSFLSPLLRGITGENKPLIKIVAKGLMEDYKIEIGMEVPLELNVYILQPHDFFALFNDQVPDESKNHAEFWAGTGKNPKSAINAFDLLQWAHYSSLPTFDPNNNAKGNNQNGIEEKGGDEEEDVDVDGKNATEEEEAPEWAQDLYSKTASPKGADSINQQLIEESDPIMLNKKGIHLRCYQRQALNWMIHREEHANEKNSEDFKRQLELLSELAASHRSAAGEDLVDTSTSGSGGTEVVGVQCAVGPVLVSNEVALQAKSLDGEEEPAVHPLWQQRFLWDTDLDGDDKAVYSFYVNELLQTASKRSPNAPRECCGGILADQMGLGKTVMLLALIAKDKEKREDANSKPTSSTGKSSCIDIIELESDEDGNGAESKPYSQSQMVSGTSNSDPITTLVVAPLSLLAQWEEEVQSKSSLSCLVYYGDQAKKLGESDLAGVDVLITTYGTVQSEYSSRRGILSSSPSTPLLSICFRRVILDEAHIIKNPNTGASKACCEINAERRWCVTGTPISNSLQDVFGLIKFLKHEPWCSKAFWKRAIQTPKVNSKENVEEAKKDIDIDNTAEAEDIGAVSRERVRRVLQPLLLRRTKDTLTQDGEPILTLPPVEAKLISVTLSDEERFFYNVLLSKSQTVFEGFIQAGTASKSWFAIFALLQRLRQSCDHLALTVKSRLEKELKNDSSAFYNVTELESPSREVDSPQNGDGEHDRFIRDLLDATNKRVAVNSIGDDDGNCTGSQFYTQSVVQSLTQCIQNNGTLSEECAICLDIPSTNDLAVTACAHIFCRSCLRDSLDRNKSVSNSDRGECPICAGEIADGDVICTQIEEASDRGTKNTTSAEDEFDARDILESALKGKSSSKIVAIVQELETIWDEDPGSKVLIFSQYLGMFDLLKREFTKRRITSLRLDGKMSLNDRSRTVKQFNSSSTTATDENGKKRGMVLLASMKACGVGLNLTAASSVFIVDPWWNHALESQCINRIHRIGQTAPKVRVRKFIVTDSVEEKIVKMQERKQGMASEVLSDKASTGNAGNPTLDDFKTIFGRS